MIAAQSAFDQIHCRSLPNDLFRAALDNANCTFLTGIKKASKQGSNVTTFYHEMKHHKK